MATYKTRIFSDTVSITADFSEASCPVTGDIGGGYQVADFRHSPKGAMRCALEQLVKASGDSTDDFRDDINAALNHMQAV